MLGFYALAGSARERTTVYRLEFAKDEGQSDSWMGMACLVIPVQRYAAQQVGIRFLLMSSDFFDGLDQEIVLGAEDI